MLSGAPWVFGAAQVVVPRQGLLEHALAKDKCQTHHRQTSGSCDWQSHWQALVLPAWSAQMLEHPEAMVLVTMHLLQKWRTTAV